jgi:Tol biopolymer transport system component/DNA-binding winged helix-turn-helix (wHTH) protein
LGANVQTQPGLVYQFGPFEVNAASGEILKDGRRIKLQEQPSRLLLALLENAGEVISREELRSRLWPDHTFVDFDGSLRVAVRKLREALNDDAENPRYIETVPKRGYRFLVPELRRVDPGGRSTESHHVATLSNSGFSNPGTADALPLASLNSSGWRSQWWWLVLPCVSLVFFLIGRRFEKPPAVGSDWKLTQLTTDPGFSNSSAISPDGKLVAYSSDRAGEGQFDLYVKQSAGGDPIRLTFDGNNNTSPDFSPDGNRIVFHSNRDGGGIFVIPAFGGEARLLVRGGLSPKFSPDGSQVAYWVGEFHVAWVVPGSGTLWVVPVAGGTARQVGTEFTAARFPIWAPDGAHLLVAGYTSTRTYDQSAIDWWIVPVNGGAAAKTGLYEALMHDRQHSAAQNEITLANPYPAGALPKPSCWLTATNSTIFSGPSGDALNIWRTGISPSTGRINGVFTRLTTGQGHEVDPSCASDNAITFTSSELRNDIWVVHFDLDKRQAKGGLERLTAGPYIQEGISLSRDGRTMAYGSNRSGTLNVWMQQADGKGFHFASSFIQRYPVLSPSGGKIAFSSFESDKRVLYIASPGKTPELVCDDCLRATDWTRDEETLLVFSNSPYQINLLDIASRQESPLLRRAGKSLLYGRFSPDEQWVSFTMRLQPDRSWIMIAPLQGPRPVSEDRWIKIAEAGAEDWANWSSDGKTLYFTSAKDGHTCLWAQRVDSGSHHPVGEPFAVEHFHGRAFYSQGGWSAGGGRIAIVLRDGTENIWMMSRTMTR